MAPVCRSACRQLRCLCVLSLTLFWYCSVAATRSYDRNTLLDLRYALASPTFYDGCHPPFTCPIADCVIRLPCCISDRRKRRRRRGKRGGVRVRIRRGASASSVQLGPCQRSKDILGRNDLYLARRSWDLSENQSDDCQEQGYRFQSFHQRVVGFSNDPYHHESRSDLPDIVTAGVLQGFYPRDVKVSFKKSSGKPSGLTCAPELPVHPRIPTITINRSDISSESERI